MAGDSQVTVEGKRLFTSDPKVWQVRPGLVVGCAGDAECDNVMSLVDWAGEPSAWRGRIRTLCEKLDCSDLIALIGYRARLYVHDGTSMWTVDGQCEAIGSGGDYARGYLHASTGEDPERRVRAAVRGAAGCTAYVGGKVRVVCT
jgi:hypothetical protein